MMKNKKLNSLLNNITLAILLIGLYLLYYSFESDIFLYHDYRDIFITDYKKLLDISYLKNLFSYLLRVFFKTYWVFLLFFLFLLKPWNKIKHKLLVLMLIFIITSLITFKLIKIGYNFENNTSILILIIYSFIKYVLLKKYEFPLKTKYIILIIILITFGALIKLTAFIYIVNFIFIILTTILGYLASKLSVRLLK
jgi:hypothetical protein